jgi:hypothetical protein
MSKLTTAEEGGTDARFLEIGPSSAVVSLLMRSLAATMLARPSTSGKTSILSALRNDGNLARRFCFPRQIEAQAAVLAQELLVVEGGRAIRPKGPFSCRSVTAYPS